MSKRWVTRAEAVWLLELILLRGGLSEAQEWATRRKLLELRGQLAAAPRNESRDEHEAIAGLVRTAQWWAGGPQGDA